MPFSRSEYDRRLFALQEQLVTQGTDIALYFGQEAANYIGGFYTHGHFAFTVFAVPRQGLPFMILRSMEELAGRNSAWIDDFVLFEDHEDPVAITADALTARGYGAAKIAIETHSWYLTVDRFTALQRALPDAKFSPEGGLCDVLRIVKSDEEIACLRQASGAVDAAMLSAISASRVGASERDVAAAMASGRILAGSDLPIDGVLTTGERTLMGHGGWTDRILQAGDKFLYEFHGISSHYWARTLRSGVLGKASAEQLDVFATCAAAQDALIAKLVDGGSSREADAACRDIMVGSGLKKAEEYTRRIGYSLGVNFRPSPGEMIRGIVPTMDFEIRTGMVFMLLCSHEGVGIGDMIAVTESGPERLTLLPRKYYELG